jgi:hypothetical protein
MMKELRWWNRIRTSWAFLFSVAACPVSGSALAAVPITQMIYAQPIDVCSSPTAPTGCPPFNTKSPIGNPSNQNQTTNPIGFLDPTTGKDITRVLLNQIGIDITWLPIVQYNNSTFQTLNVLQGSTTCGLGMTVTGYQSCDFLNLSQQPQISKIPNPAYTPTFPLASNPNVVNIFFVTKLNPPASQLGTQIYDLSWVGNNGAAVGGNVFFPPFPLTARTDVLAHGIMHMLGADHPILGAGPYDPWNATTNPLGGVVPPFPSNPPPTTNTQECDSGYPACMANLMTTGNLRSQPSPACMLAVPPLPSSCLVNGVAKPTFSNGMADQLTTEAMQNALLPLSQQGYVLDPSGFLNPVADTPTIASQTKTGSPITFNLSGPTGGLSGDTLTAWILIVPQGQTLKTKSPFSVISESRKNLLQDVDYPHPDTDVPYSPCTPATVQCVEVEFNRNPGQGFGATDFINFSLSILTGGSPITLDELCGAKVVYILHSGSIITSALSGSGPCSGATVLTANTQSPDVTTPNQVVSPATLATVTVPPCKLDPTTNLCPDPTVEGIQDGNPSEEAQLCYFHGSPVQCP